MPYCFCIPVFLPSRRYYLAAHYTALANAAKGAELKDVAAQQLTSALRYCGIVPADKAFFEAGIAWKEAGQLSMAFVMLNRYLDLCDAMDEPDSTIAVSGAVKTAVFGCIRSGQGYAMGTHDYQKTCRRTYSSLQF
eukprot:1152272-Pelagomonas_calceolata.AAC.3